MTARLLALIDTSERNMLRAMAGGAVVAVVLLRLGHRLNGGGPMPERNWEWT